MSVAANPFPRLPSKPFSFDNQTLKAPLGHPSPSEFKKNALPLPTGKEALLASRAQHEFVWQRILAFNFLSKPLMEGGQGKIVLESRATQG